MNDTKNIGECDGINDILDDVKYNLFFLKDSKYVMKLMTTYGSLHSSNDQKETYRIHEGSQVPFKYT